jgi:predicted GNAT family acetyltransferase
MSIPLLYGEMLKLENSIKHLRRSNEELRLHGVTEEEDTSWIQPVIAENEQVITKQSEQVELVKCEIAERGSRSEHPEEAMLNRDSVNGTLNDGNGEENSEQKESDDGDRMDVDEPTNGVHL